MHSQQQSIICINRHYPCQSKLNNHKTTPSAHIRVTREWIKVLLVAGVQVKLGTPILIWAEDSIQRKQEDFYCNRPLLQRKLCEKSDSKNPQEMRLKCQL